MTVRELDCFRDLFGTSFSALQLGAGNRVLHGTTLRGVWMLQNEPPDYNRWAFYVAMLELTLQLTTWLTSL